MTTRERPVALVTGASRGIGKAIAEDLSRTHHIIAGARSLSALDELLRAVPSAEPFIVDMNDDGALGNAISRLSRVDVLVHSAGIAIEKPFAALTRADWRTSFEVNVFGVADLTARLLPALRAAHGTIVMINSGSGLFSYKNGSVYTGTKFALRTMADCLREEERDNNVRVISIHPGFVDTKMGRDILTKSGVPYNPTDYVRPETIAAGVRVAIDAPPEAQFEMMSIRPSRSLRA